MTRVTSTPSTSKKGSKNTSSKVQQQHTRQTGSVDQYAIQNGPCTMNYFGAGSLKSEWE